MSIATEITRLQNAKELIKTAIENKGITVPNTEKLDTYDDYILQISGGGGTYQEKTVSASESQQEIIADDGYDALSKVTINAAKLQSKALHPQTGAPSIATPDAGYYGFKTVVLSPVTKSIDSNIQAENIKSGVSILGVYGTFTGEGGLPAGIKAVAFGEYIPAVDMSTMPSITHGLGEKPDYIIFEGGDIDITDATKNYECSCFYIGTIPQQYGTSSATLSAVQGCTYKGPSYPVPRFGVPNSTSYQFVVDESTFYPCKSSSSIYLKQGNTYKWTAIKLAN